MSLNSHRKYYIIIFLASFAMLGLATIQLYWLDKAALLNQEHFERTVYGTLQSISRKLEAREAYGFMKSEVELSDFNEEKLDEKAPNSGKQRFLGLSLSDLEDAPPELDLKGAYGVYIKEVYTDSPAAMARLRNGDIITSINQQPVNSVLQVRELLNRLSYHKNPISIAYERRCNPEKTQLISPDNPVELQDLNVQMPIDAHDSLDQALGSELGDLSNILQNLIENPQRSIWDKVCHNINMDSLITTEFKTQGIRIKPEWEIAQNYTETVQQSAAFNPQQRDNKVYQINLFPLDLSQPPSHLNVYFHQEQQYLKQSNLVLPLLALLFIGLLISCFAYTLYALFYQKKISELKTDFINNMTHELKTPVATIRLATDMALDKSFQKEPAMLNRYLGIIHDENNRLASQIEKVLQFARLERGEIKLNIEAVDVHEVLNALIKPLMLVIEQRNGVLHTQFEAQHSIIQADRLHLSNIFSNILDNAIKYSPTALDISVTTYNTPTGIAIEVSDKGIGMSKDVQQRIFEAFYREPHGNLHDVKGFGLGLSYVKQMITAHRGDIQVKSKIKQGSNFLITLPFK